MSTDILCCLFILTVSFVSAAPGNNVGDMLPPNWSGMCQSETRDNLTYISCSVTQDDEWDFSHFRNWSAGLDVLVSLDVVCVDGGSVCLPWPYRASNLDVLKYRNCVAKCYYDDFHKPEVLRLPDTLRLLEEDNVTVEMSIHDVLAVDVRVLPPALDCGPLRLEKYIQRRRKHVFVNSTKTDLSVNDTQITNKMTRNVESMLDVDHVCVYENLRVYDISQSDVASKTSLFMVLVNSRFPELRTLNLSRRHISKYPTALKQYRHQLQKLETIDLSHNNIQQFQINEDDVPTSRTYINLQNNNIETLGNREIRSFQSSVIDIRGNPLKCECNMAEFADFLRQHRTPADAGINPYYSYLWTLTCAFPLRRQGEIIAHLSPSDFCADSKASSQRIIALIIAAGFTIIIVVAVVYRFRESIFKHQRSLFNRKPKQLSDSGVKSPHGVAQP